MHDLVIVHSSDLHLGVEHRTMHLGSLQAVAEATAALRADVLLLAGDIFDHNRLPLALIDVAARRLSELKARVIILPGNHDCLAPNSVYRRGGLAEVPNLEVLGLTVDPDFVCDELDLEVWGRPHQDHVDMAPLEGAPPRHARHHITVAHGHWVTGPHDRHRSWLLHDEEIEQLQTDYLALGHWDRAVAVGDGRIPAYYSGSPELARTVNVVTFPSAGGIRVARYPLLLPED